MQAPGMAEAERAKADGRWDAAYAGQKTATVPEDLAAALAASPAAAEFFATLDSQNRYSILYRVQDSRSRKPGPAGSRSSSRCWPSIGRSTPDLAARWM